MWSPSHLWSPFPTWLLWHTHSISSKNIQKGTLLGSLLNYWNSPLISLTFPLLPSPPTSLLNPAASVIPLNHARLCHSSETIPPGVSTSFTVTIHMQTRLWDSPAPPHIKSLIASPTAFPWFPGTQRAQLHFTTHHTCHPGACRANAFTSKCQHGVTFQWGPLWTPDFKLQLVLTPITPTPLYSLFFP